MRVVLLCLLLALLAPASASAAGLVKSGSTLTYTAAAGRTNLPNFTLNGTTVHVDRSNGDDDALQSSTCTPTAGGEYDCAQIARIVVDARDGDDIVTATGVSLPI